jgi:hypothetical protein
MTPLRTGSLMGLGRRQIYRLRWAFSADGPVGCWWTVWTPRSGGWAGTAPAIVAAGGFSLRTENRRARTLTTPEPSIGRPATCRPARTGRPSRFVSNCLIPVIPKYRRPNPSQTMHKVAFNRWFGKVSDKAAGRCDVNSKCPPGSNAAAALCAVTARICWVRRWSSAVVFAFLTTAVFHKMALKELQ